MNLRHLPLGATLADHEALARELLAAHAAGDPQALGVIHRCHPRFLDEKVPWLPRDVSDEEIASAGFDLDDARLAVARAHSFQDWQALHAWLDEMAAGGAVARFERAAEAAIDGDLHGLQALLREDPGVAHGRSTRRTCFDPPVHGATLLHYVAANGVEGHRQRTPANGVAIARALLGAGAEVDALAGFYGCRCATLSLLVSSSHPAEAGIQGELAELLLEHGASIEGTGETWGSPLVTALLFGFPETAGLLAARGARVGLAGAAGLGRTDEVRDLLPVAEATERHLALALGAQLGHVDAVRVLLDAGEDPDRFNPEHAHAHATPLHHAALGGHLAVVELLVAGGARLDIADRIYRSTPLGWARHHDRRDVVDLLLAHGAS